MPIRRIRSGCALVTNGHAAAAPPRRLMNARRLIIGDTWFAYRAIEHCILGYCGREVLNLSSSHLDPKPI